MDNNSGVAGPFAGSLSFFSAILAWITIKDVQAVFAIAASAVAIASGCYAIRYYHKKFNEK